MRTHSRIGFILSILIHTLVFGTLWAIAKNVEFKPQNTQTVTSISLEMFAARLEQPQVAVAENIEQELVQVSEPDDAVEPQPEPEPILPKPKPVEKAKPKVQEKPKPAPEKPKKTQPKEKSAQTDKKVKTEKVVKALEKGRESQQGIVAKAVPNAVVSKNAQAGSGQSTSGSNNSVSNSNEVNAYKAQLQRALQQRANSAYPQRERMMRKGGIVTINFYLARTGEISQVRVVSSSGNSNLDNAAVKAAQRTRMPPPPAGVPHSFTVPVKFSVE